MIVSSSSDSTSIIRTGREVWEALETRSGLSLPKSGRYGYDEDILNELRRELLSGEAGNIGELLERNEIGVERVLSVVLRSLSPFTDMMRDVLDMFVAASAKRSGKQLRLSVDFDEFIPAVDFELAEFREQVEQFVQASRFIRRRRWTVNNGWEIANKIKESEVFVSDHKGRYYPEPRDQEIRDWLSAMESRTHNFPAVPPSPRSGVPEYDEVVSELWSDFTAYQNRLRAVFGNYCRITDVKPKDEDTQDWDSKLFQVGAHDFWPRETVRYLTLLSELLKTDRESMRTLNLVKEVIEEVDKISTPPEPVEEFVRVLEDIISLPIWERRHELYAVWVAARITKQFANVGVTFHPVGDVLSFPFRATHIATLGPAKNGQLELWSELRSPAAPNPIGRVGQIQPDYRIKFSRAEGPGSGIDLLIVECKQYRRSCTKNFSSALIDYAQGSRISTVVLVNYGPVGDAVMKRICRDYIDVQDRCKAIGETRPGGAGLITFRELLDNVRLGVFGNAQSKAWLQQSIKIELHWGKAIDLDLHIATAAATCGYSSQRVIREVCFVADNLGRDILPASEELHVTPVSTESFYIIVVAFNRVNQVREAEAHVVIRWRDQRGDEHHSKPIKLDGANTSEWHVATLMRGEQSPIIINRPANGFKDGFGWEPRG